MSDEASRRGPTDEDVIAALGQTGCLPRHAAAHNLPHKLPQPPSAEESFMGNQLLRMNRQSGAGRADNSAIYDSILYPLAKASNHRWKEITEGDEEFDPNAPWEPPYPYLAYLIPVIVTAGLVYTVDAVSAEPKVSKVKWARLRRRFQSK